MGFLDIFRKSKNKIAYDLVSDAKNNMEKQLGTKTETMPDVRVERVRNDRRGRYNPNKDRLGITQDIFEEYLRKSKLVEYYKKNKPYDFEKNVFKLKPSYEINMWVNPKSEDAYNRAYKRAYIGEKKLHDYLEENIYHELIHRDRIISNFENNSGRKNPKITCAKEAIANFGADILSNKSEMNIIKSISKLEMQRTQYIRPGEFKGYVLGHLAALGISKWQDNEKNQYIKKIINESNPYKAINDLEVLAKNGIETYKNHVIKPEIEKKPAMHMRSEFFNDYVEKRSKKLYLFNENSKNKYRSALLISLILLSVFSFFSIFRTFAGTQSSTSFAIQSIITHSYTILPFILLIALYLFLRKRK